MKNDLAIGLVGSDSAAYQRADAVARIPGAHLAAVADHDEAAAQKLAQVYNQRNSNSKGNSNGNSFDRQGRQLSCEHANRRVVRYEHDGSLTVLAERWNGKPLNAPNDVVDHPDGGVWFTDPGYGSLMEYEGNRLPSSATNVQPIQKEAIYRIDAPGHTEFIAELCGVQKVTMMLTAATAHGSLAVTHVSTHVSLATAIR